MLTRFKVAIAAFFAFVAAIFTANFYRKKANRLHRQVINEKAKIHNFESQLKAAQRKQEKFKKEIEDAVKDDSYLSYFDHD